MKVRKLFDHPSGHVIACEDNPAYYVEAPANTIAITRRGDVYRKFNSAGADGWVLLCAEGGPRIAAFLDDERDATASDNPTRDSGRPEQALNAPESASATLGAIGDDSLRETL